MNPSFLSKNLLNGGGVNAKQKINSLFLYNELQLHEQEFIERGDINVKQKKIVYFFTTNFSFMSKNLLNGGGDVNVKQKINSLFLQRIPAS